LKYIHTSRFYKYESYIAEEKDVDLLFSREFDRQFDLEMNKIAEKYPDAYIIVVLRSNEQWIASQYRRYVKNGGSRPFEEFIDIKENKGVWKIKDAEFRGKLEFIKKNFKNRPLILLYDELKKDPHMFFSMVAEYTNSSYDRDEINLNPKHRSYSEKQLMFLRNLTKKLYKKEPDEFTKGDVSWLKFRSRWLLLHIGLYIASVLPLRYDHKLIPDEMLSQYKGYYRSDWQQCLQIINENNENR
jgi:hypothetical protein